MARRFCFYIPWSRLAETGVDTANLDNRFVTMTEVRRGLWPYSKDAYNLPPDGGGIDEAVQTFIVDRLKGCTDEITHMGCPTTVVERRDLSGVTVTLNGLDANAIDTLVVLSFDHFSTGQVPDRAEVEWLQRFLQDPRKCAVLCPHHDIGAEAEYETQVKEFLHHGDPLEPPQDRVGGYARTLLADLGYPIEGRYGLKAAANRNTSPIEPAPLKLGPAPDTKKILRDVYTFTGHPHLPHLYVPDTIRNEVKILARQTIDPAAPPHPCLKDDTFNAFLELDGFDGTVFVSDLTLWIGATPDDGGKPGLTNLWRNAASMQ